MNINRQILLYFHLRMEQNLNLKRIRILMKIPFSILLINLFMSKNLMLKILQRKLKKNHQMILNLKNIIVLINLYFIKQIKKMTQLNLLMRDCQNLFIKNQLKNHHQKIKNMFLQKNHYSIKNQVTLIQRMIKVILM